VLPNAFVRELVGAKAPEQVRFTDQVLATLAKISPTLVPKLFSHPYADAIMDGVSSLTTLVDLLNKAKSDDERAAIVDAMAEVFIRENATKPAIDAVNKLFETSKSEQVVTLAARALAVANDPGFLEQQRNFLASKEPTDLRRAALLLGYGRHAAAVPALLDVLRDDQMAIADVVIWALGEIGDPAALPKLHRLLNANIRVSDVLDAVGKIGDATSAVRLLPILVEGAQDHREKAAQAMAKIARNNDGVLLDAELTTSVRLVLERIIDKDDSRLARFHAIVAFSLLGGALDPKRVLMALGGEIAEKDLDAMSQVMMKKKAPPKEKPALPTKSAAKPAPKPAPTPAPKGKKPV